MPSALANCVKKRRCATPSRSSARVCVRVETEQARTHEGMNGRERGGESDRKRGETTAQLNKNIIRKRPNAETGKRTAAVLSERRNRTQARGPAPGEEDPTWRRRLGLGEEGKSYHDINWGRWYWERRVEIDRDTEIVRDTEMDVTLYQPIYYLGKNIRRLLQIN